MKESPEVKCIPIPCSNEHGLGVENKLNEA